MEKIVLVGNPNTGKTSLFNTITKCHEKVANYSGVTVKEREKCVKCFDKELQVVDLPGIYSSNTIGEDEKVSMRYISENKSSNIIYVASTLDIEKNMHLFIELVNQGYNLSLFINENSVKLKKENIDKIKDILQIPIYYGDARKGRRDILSWIVNAVISFTPLSKLSVTYNELIKLFEIEPINLQRLDKILLHPIFGKVIFIVILGVIYYLSFISVGERLSGLVFNYWESLWEYCLTALGRYEMFLLIDYLQVVVIKGIGSVVAFLPQLFIILFCMYVLEECGYLPRVAYLFNIDLNKIGLNGKSIFGLSVGIGCTTSGFLTSRNIEDRKCRVMTCRLMPFIGCSAKLPIILFLTNFLLQGRTLIIFAVLLLVLFAGFCYLKALKSDEKNSFIIEIPRLKVPSAKRLTTESFYIVKDFFKRVAVTILFITSLVWLFMTIELKISENTVTLLDLITQAMGILFKPIGLNIKPLMVSLITGLVAKENILSTIAMFGGVSDVSQEALITFIIFVIMYSPCIPSLKCLKEEFNKSFAWSVFLTQTGLAYGTSFVFYTFSMAFGLWFGFIVSACFIFLGISFCKIISMRKSLNCKNCIVKA